MAHIIVVPGYFSASATQTSFVGAVPDEQTDGDLAKQGEVASRHGVVNTALIFPEARIASTVCNIIMAMISLEGEHIIVNSTYDFSSTRRTKVSR
ncbi:hypothetical protein Noc_1579 [Nitrosococcus oceani ATCC 19707]|uniref:Uncharacterized protein n=2 Tax=Nitrosococcus oceani TaxID=1229 RepID=Q3JAT8_NITOC|nr:hypothetical protein Noc_1579 [Nitrosococcus oceani ATCC 19707]KFI19498.1 hypothetical protein IB75_08340 [Nitrosococcus oceani C-27]